MRKALGLVALAATLTAVVGLANTAANAAVTGYSAVLTASNVVPASASGYTGQAVFSIDDSTNEVCVQSAVASGADAVTANQIFTGNAGVAGSLLLDFGADQLSCVTTSPANIAALVASPPSYYYEIATEDFPDGAVRGQLAAVVVTTSSSSTSTSSSTTTTAARTTPVSITPRFTG